MNKLLYYRNKINYLRLIGGNSGSQVMKSQDNMMELDTPIMKSQDNIMQPVMEYQDDMMEIDPLVMEFPNNMNQIMTSPFLQIPQNLDIDPDEIPETDQHQIASCISRNKNHRIFILDMNNILGRFNYKYPNIPIIVGNRNNYKINNHAFNLYFQFILTVIHTIYENMQPNLNNIIICIGDPMREILRNNVWKEIIRNICKELLKISYLSISYIFWNVPIFNTIPQEMENHVIYHQIYQDPPVAIIQKYVKNFLPNNINIRIPRNTNLNEMIQHAIESPADIFMYDIISRYLRTSDNTISFQPKQFIFISCDQARDYQIIPLILSYFYKIQNNSPMEILEGNVNAITIQFMNTMLENSKILLNTTDMCRNN